MNLAEVSWVRAEAALGKTDLAIVPVGAVEVYGRHLPMGADGWAAAEVTRRLAARVGAVTTPLVPIGCSQALMSFPGTLSVSSTALKAYLGDLADSLAFHGVRRILFLNGHAGNVPPIGELCRELGERGIKAAQVDWWRAVYRAGGDLTETGDLANGHAGEVGTSVMLAVVPRLVEPDMMVKEKPDYGRVAEFPEVIQYDRTYRQMSASGTVGDPFAGSAEKGEALINRFLDRVEAFLKEW